jgi:hypothetical protein
VVKRISSTPKQLKMRMKMKMNKYNTINKLLTFENKNQTTNQILFLKNTNRVEMIKFQNFKFLKKYNFNVTKRFFVQLDFNKKTSTISEETTETNKIEETPTHTILTQDSYNNVTILTKVVDLEKSKEHSKSGKIYVNVNQEENTKPLEESHENHHEEKHHEEKLVNTTHHETKHHGDHDNHHGIKHNDEHHEHHENHDHHDHHDHEEIYTDNDGRLFGRPVKI